MVRVYKVKGSNEMVEDSLPMWPFNIGVRPPEHNLTFAGSIIKSMPLCIENRRDNDAHYFLSLWQLTISIFHRTMDGNNKLSKEGQF